jgi:hypothetical protein
VKDKIEFTALVVFIFASLALARLAFAYGGIDFGVYYAAAKVTAQGGNPYEYGQLAPQIVSNTGQLNNPYYYAPWFTWSLIPFTFLPYPIARAAWAILNFLLWIFSLRNLSKVLDYPPPGWARWGMWLAATVVFAWSTWGSEQVGVLIFFLFTLILLNAARENRLVTGILLALILFKPNITLLPALMIALWILLRERTWKTLLAMTTTLASLLALSFLLTPNWHLALYDPDKLQGLSYTLNASGGSEIQRYTTTLRDFLSVYGVAGSASSAIQILVALLGLACIGYGMRSCASLTEYSALVILVNFAIAPYALFYDYPSQVIPMFLANSILLKTPSLKRLRIFANMLIAFSLFIGDGIPYRYWITVVLIAFLAAGFYFERRNRFQGNTVAIQ